MLETYARGLALEGRDVTHLSDVETHLTLPG